MAELLRTRFAPSPTGAFHLGNARTFALTWLHARACGGEVVLRMEDIDVTRVRPGAAAALLEDLRWLGLDWDGPMVVQSSRSARHRECFERLHAMGLLYPCTCTHQQIRQAASAPHADEELTYPGTCRGRWPDAEAARAAAPAALGWRVRTDAAGEMRFDDLVAGPQCRSPERQGGDFVVARDDAQISVGYQLAVVVDDADAGVNLVVRGDDLLPSTPRQMLLQRALGMPTPAYAHLGMVHAADGTRLAKRRGTQQLRDLRAAGESARGILEWIARSAGATLDDFASPQRSRWRLNPQHATSVLAP